MNKKNMKRGLAVAAMASLVLTGAVAAQAANTQHDVRQSDFISGLSDTRATGHFDFLKEGIRLYTESNTSTDKVAEYYPVTGPIPTSGSYDWYGTANQPGSQIVFDLDGVTNSVATPSVNDYNVLVGEQIYSTNAPGQDLTDWWLTPSSYFYKNNHAQCPSTSGGSGSDCHGTLAQWKAVLGTDARQTAGGFSLGSGLKGDGVLRSEAYGSNDYVFTDEKVATPAPPTPTVTVTATPTGTPGTTPPVTRPRQNVSATERHERLQSGSQSGRVVMTSAQLKSGSDEGNKVIWKITIAPTKDYPKQQTERYSDTMGSGETSSFGYYTYPGYDKTITVYKNGVVVDTFRVHSPK